MKTYGYCRVSRPTQNIERQVRNIKANYPDAFIVTETYTGTTENRPAFQKLLNLLKSDDTLVFDSVSRMCRNSKEGFQLYEQLYNSGINLIFLKEPMINTSTYQSALSQQVKMTGSDVDLILEGVNKYLMLLAKEQIKIAFDQAQKEVDDMRQRTKEGIVTARLNGKQIGRKRGTRVYSSKEAKTKQIIQSRCKAFGGPNTDAETMKLAGVSKATYYRYKKEIKGK